jgi:hypothetical protein
LGGVHETSSTQPQIELKSPCRDGALRVIFEPLDFIARLAALVPKPRVNLSPLDARPPWRVPFGRTTCVQNRSRRICHGVFAPNSKYRARVTPPKRGRGAQHDTREDPEEPTPAERHASMTWAQRLKRVFGIGIETCSVCGGAVRIIACIEDAAVIEKILTHLDAKAAEP